MTDDPFVLTLPVFIVMIPGRNGKIMTFISEGEEAVRGAALFTEGLFAQRARDHLEPTAQIIEIADWHMLEHFHLESLRHAGYEWIVVDPHHETGQGVFIPIERVRESRP